MDTTIYTYVSDVCVCVCVGNTGCKQNNWIDSHPKQTYFQRIIYCQYPIWLSSVVSGFLFLSFSEYAPPVFFILEMFKVQSMW